LREIIFFFSSVFLTSLFHGGSLLFVIRTSLLIPHSGFLIPHFFFDSMFPDKSGFIFFWILYFSSLLSSLSSVQFFYLLLICEICVICGLFFLLSFLSVLIRCIRVIRVLSLLSSLF